MPCLPVALSSTRSLIISALLCCCIFMGVGYDSIAQAPCIQWQRTYGGTDVDGDAGDYQDIYDYAIGVQQTNDGGFIACGYSQSHDGDVVANHGGGDVWVIKTDAAGNLQWQKTYGGTLAERPYAISKAPDGGYIFVAYTNSSDGDVTGGYDGPGGPGDRQDIWVVKIDASGNIQWQKAIGGTGSEIPYDVRATADGGYILCGATASFDGDVVGHQPANSSFEADDMWIVKLSATGSIQWQKCIGGSINESASSIRQTSDGGYIVVGTSLSNDGDIPATPNFVNCVVAKLTPSGTIAWLRLLGGKISDQLYDIVQNPDGSYTAAGYGIVPYGDPNIPGTVFSPWLVKLSNTGAIVWNKFPGDHLDNNLGGVIELTSDNGYILSTYWMGQSIDNMIYKLDANGNDQWKKKLGGSQHDYAASAIQTADGGYLMASMTKSNDGDVSGNHGNSDLWLVKLGPLPAPSATVTQPDCLHPTGSITVTNPVGTAYQYTTGNGFQASPVFNNLAPAAYQLQYKGSDGCVSAAATFTVLPVVPTITTAPAATVSKSPSCSNASGGEITVASPTGSNFSYSVGGTYQASPVFSGLVAATYPVTAKDNTSGCVSPIFSLTVAGAGTAAAPVGTGAKLCGPGQVTLRATGSGTIRWYTDAALTNLVFTGNAYTLNMASTTDFYVTAGDGACTSPAVKVTGTIAAIPPKPFAEKDLTLCPNSSIVLNAGNAAHYLWQDNSTGSTFTVSGAGTYYVKVTNADGCSNTATVNVIADLNCQDLYFANAFTPDGNGTNDRFGAIGNYSFITRFSLEIFDRYGKLVFSTNDPAKKWNGLYQGQPYNTGSFAWHSRYYFKNEYREKKGTVVLIR